MKIAVVGGGLAGLAAAAELVERHEVTLLEARPTLPNAPIAPRLLGRARSLERLLSLTRASEARLDEPAPFQLASLPFRDRARLLRAAVALAHPTARWPRAGEHESVERWLDRLGQSARARNELWHPLARDVLEEDPHQGSAALLESVLAEALFFDRRPHPELRRTGLAGWFFEHAARFFEARGGRVITAAKVSAIAIDDRSARGVVLTSGRRIDADLVIATLPPRELPTLLPPAARNGERWCEGLSERGARPGVQSPFEGLYLTGPFVRTGLPPNLESAARSAEEAARLAERYRPLPSERPRASGAFVPVASLRRPTLS